MRYLIGGLAVGAVGLGGILYYRSRHAAPVVQTPKTITKTVIKTNTVTIAARPVVRTQVVVQRVNVVKPVPTAEQAATQAAVNAFKPAIPELVERAGAIAADALQSNSFASGGVNLLAPTLPSQSPDSALRSIASPPSDPSQSPMGAVGNTIGAVSGFVGAIPAPVSVAVADIVARDRFRGASESDQAAQLGAASVDAAQYAIGTAIPVLGSVIAAGLGVVAGTYEGSRAVKATGVAEEQVYQLQKDIVNLNFDSVNDTFSGGGSSHAERAARDAAALAAAQARQRLESEKEAIANTIALHQKLIDDQAFYDSPAQVAKRAAETAAWSAKYSSWSPTEQQVSDAWSRWSNYMPQASYGGYVPYPTLDPNDPEGDNQKRADVQTLMTKGSFPSVQQYVAWGNSFTPPAIPTPVDAW